MTWILDNRPALAILASLVAAALILLSRPRPNLREFWTFAAAFVKLALVASMVPTVLRGDFPDMAPLTLAPGVTLHLKVDALGLLFALVASSLWVVTSVYSVGYMRELKEKHQTGYFAAFAVCVSSAIGIAFSANLLTFFVFFELLTIATYPLVVHKRTPEAIRAGRKYLGYTLLAGQALLIAIVWSQTLVPGGEFAAGGFLGRALESGRITPGPLRVLFGLFILGCGVKAAIMPIHGWLPTAMIAPTPVSALLHAVAVVKAGVFGVVRVVGFVFGPELVQSLGVGKLLAVAAGTTIIAASVIALVQDNLKRRLAYSTVGQLSYIVLGAALAAPAAILGAMLHIVAHAFMKITLFFCAGSIYAHAHKTNISELDGLGRRMPLTFAAFTVGSLGLAGMPLVVGFVSKWKLGQGAIQAGQPVYVVVLVISALLNIAYFFPIILRAYFHKPAQPEKLDEARWELLAPPVLTALVALVLGVWPNAAASFVDLAVAAATSVSGTASAVAAGGGL